MHATYQNIRSGSARIAYFLIKSFQADHIELSQKHSIWATTSRNERIIASAFENHDYVVLIFSVNASGKFYGYAVVTGLSPPDNLSHSTAGGPVFVGSDGRTFPGKPFGIKWIVTMELPFKHFDHINNANNDNKPVKVGRDGQLISLDAGNKILDVYQKMYETAQKAVPSHNSSGAVGGEWMYSSTVPANEENLDWESTFIPANSLLSIYPIDLTKLNYSSYCELYQASADYLRSNDAVVTPPIVGYGDWSQPSHTDSITKVITEQQQQIFP